MWNKLWYLVELATWIAPVAFKINSSGYLDAIAARDPHSRNKKKGARTIATERTLYNFLRESSLW